MTISLPHYPGYSGPIEVDDSIFKDGSNSEPIDFPAMIDDPKVRSVKISSVTVNGYTGRLDKPIVMYPLAIPRFPVGSLRIC